MARAEPCGESRGKGCQGRENTVRKEGGGSQDTVRAVRVGGGAGVGGGGRGGGAGRAGSRGSRGSIKYPFYIQ